MPAADIEDRLRRALALPGDDSSDFDLNPDLPLPEGRVLRPAGPLPLPAGTAGPPARGSPRGRGAEGGK